MKTVLGCFLIIGMIVLLYRCAKEYSCEFGRCRQYDRDVFIIPPIDVDKWPPRNRDTAYNELIAYYDFYIVDNSKVKKIYFNVQTKYIPGHYQIIDTIPVQQSRDGYYTGHFDIRSYKLGAGVVNYGRIFYDSCFQKKDTFKYYFEVRYRDATFLRSDTVTLIY